MSGTKEKIGILGGTFDPIHMGHLIIAEQARDQYSLDRVLLIPSGHSYFKDNREQKVLSGQMRLEMTRIAAEGYAPFRVSDIEVNRPGNTYSFETLEEIAQDNPGALYGARRNARGPGGPGKARRGDCRARKRFRRADPSRHYSEYRDLLHGYPHEGRSRKIDTLFGAGSSGKLYNRKRDLQISTVSGSS